MDAMKAIWIILLLLMTGGCTGFPSLNSPATPERRAVSSEARVLNDYRASKGLSKLIEHYQLTSAAQAHAVESGGRSYVGHYSANDDDPIDRVERAGYSAAGLAENSHGGDDTFEEAMIAWLTSTPHREVLDMEPASHFGVGFSFNPASQHKWHWVLLIAEPR